MEHRIIRYHHTRIKNRKIRILNGWTKLKENKFKYEEDYDHHDYARDVNQLLYGYRNPRKRIEDEIDKIALIEDFCRFRVTCTLLKNIMKLIDNFKQIEGIHKSKNGYFIMQEGYRIKINYKNDPKQFGRIKKEIEEIIYPFNNSCLGYKFIL